MWYSPTCNCKNGKYLVSITDDLAITCDEVVESSDEETKAISANFNEKKDAKFLYCTCILINYYSIIDSC